MPGGRPREFDIDEALEAAVEVFRDFGYAGTSVAALTDAMGVNRPSLYAAFGNKDSLFESVVERYAAGWQEGFDDLRRREDVREALSDFVDWSAVSFTRPGKPKGCLVWTCMACFGPGGPKPGSALARAHDFFAGSLLGHFERAHREGALPTEEDLGLLTRFCLSHLQGLSTMARAGTDRADLRATARIGMRALW